PRPPRDRERLRSARGARPGRGHRGKGHQRAPLPVLQGHHGRQVQAGDGLHPGRPGYRPGRGRRRRCHHRGRRLRPPAPPPVWAFAPRPPRQAGQQVKDPGDGSAAVELAEFLASNRFILDREGKGMARVLVLVEDEDGVTKKVTYEMLTKARALGEPVALFVGDGLDTAQEGLARHGATAVYAAGGDNRLTGTLTGALEAPADRPEPAVVLVAATPLGKDAGARLAARKGWGMLADVVDLDGDLVATQNVFGGATTVRSRVRAGTPGLAVKPNSFPVGAAPATPEVVDLELAAGVEEGVRVTDHVVQEQGGRPDVAEAEIVVC